MNTVALLRLSITAVSLSLLSLPALSGEIPADYYSRNDFLQASATAFDNGLSGFTNPANLTFLKAFESRFYWSTEGVDAWSFGNWGVFGGGRNLGLGIQRQKFGDNSVIDYRISLAHGTPAHSVGIAYGWSTGDTEIAGHFKMLSLGTVMRPFPFISLGLLGSLSLQNNWNEAVAEIGVRPLRDSRLTLFADASIQKGMRVEDMPWSAGAAVEIVDGFKLVGRYFDSEAFTIGFTASLGQSGLGGQTKFDNEQNHAGYSYYIRAGGMQPSILPEMVQKEKKYVPMNLKGRIDYNKFVFFDDGTIRFMDVLKDIKAAVDDDRVGAIVLNLSSMRIYPEHAWEIREELRRAREVGKKVIIFFDRAAMTSYHLASIADKIVMDPEGSMELFGFVTGRTYFKGTLEKLGLGFDEWRFFKYKSAAERLSRDSFSEADREQRQDYIDDRYELVRDEICQSRSISYDKFDDLIDNQAYFMPHDAVECGLVDALARWSDKNKVIENLLEKKYSAIGAKHLMSNALPQKSWGELPKIAVVYGLGDCAMDSGIRARWLEHVFLGLKSDYNVKAVVFRVDSPGGDPMASDLVAQALRKCGKVKPVIVSQGQVAGSGGYHISLYGDKIVAGPNTVTGSIGVIGGWIYDKSFGDKIGMTSDHVKRGKHADLGFGITLPFLNLSIPARNLDDEERMKMEGFIREYYDGFVRKVADGRNMPVDDVKKIAEGHFYSGIRGKKIGLVDEIGGLTDAITIARNEAGLKPDDEYEIIEIPKSRGWLDLKSQVSPLSVNVEHDDVVQYIKMSIENAGRPLPMLYPGTYPSWEE